ncbi:helix-turn-helix transcriptional regulator [Saccharothrix saharensis]|uniref:helix-turn-helix transcriptional regulator n=1 Tax=Saccharothrix saharensis TaxID=571190 RepID=UPI0036AB1BC6
MTDHHPPEADTPAATRLAHTIKELREQAKLSQNQLGKRIGYTRQYISLAERPNHNLPSLDLIRALDHALNAHGQLLTLRQQAKTEQQMRRLAAGARKQAEVAPTAALPTTADSSLIVEPKSDAVTLTSAFGGSSADAGLFDLPIRPGGVRYVAALVDGLHRDYQAARYAEVAQALPGVVGTVAALVEGTAGDRHRQALRLQCQTAVVAAKLATKLGDGITAYAAAERARMAADEAGDPFGQAAAAYQLTCALLRLGGADEAETHTVQHAEALTGHDLASLTWRGTLTLISAVIAARRGDPVEARRRLDHAEQLAARLPGDLNIGFTAFGPTNVRIHRTSVALSTDDPHEVLATGERVDITALPPGLHGRQGQFHLDSAWAHTRLGDDPLAVIHLLETERVAPQLLRTHRTARTLVHGLLRRERRHTMPGLRGLANRIGVLP